MVSLVAYPTTNSKVSISFWTLVDSSHLHPTSAYADDESHGGYCGVLRWDTILQLLDRDGEGEGELRHSSNALEGGGEDTILATNTQRYSISFQTSVSRF